MDTLSPERDRSHQLLAQFLTRGAAATRFVETAAQVARNMAFEGAPMFAEPLKLHQERGHRRLNVAITRARVGVTIFASVLPEEIDASRTRAAGVIDLKNYLEFAVKGPRAIAEQSLPTGREPDSPFEADVIRRLRDKGWTVHPQVGCSGYRIDMAVVDPQSSGRYVLGIECDGATYHSLPTARDRDRLRQSVLEGLGWQLHRIWSTDWWLDPDRELAKVEASLRRRTEAVGK